MTAGAVDRRTPTSMQQTHWWRDRARCADATPEEVDAAFAYPGGQGGKYFKRRFCEPCPVRDECLAEALATGEWGVWGETTPTARTKAGGVRPTYRVRQK